MIRSRLLVVVVLAALTGSIVTPASPVSAINPTVACSSGNFDGGDGSAGSPFMLSTEAHLVAVTSTSDCWTKHFLQLQDITLTASWTPIAAGDATGFVGNFDGNLKRISGLTINNAAQYSGLFAKTGPGAVLRNIRLFGPQIQGGNTYYGALVGQASDSLIQNVTVTAAEIGTTASPVGDNAGAVVGGARSVTFSNVTVDIPTIRGSSRIGGFAGVVFDGTSTFTNVDVIAPSIWTRTSGSFVGGMIGDVSFNGGSEGSATLTDVRVTAPSAIGSDAVGGVVGWLNGLANARSSMTRVTVTDPFVRATGRAGGAVGVMSRTDVDLVVVDSGTVRQSSGTSHGGGIAGVAASTTIQNSHSTTEVTVSGFGGGLIGIAEQSTTLTRTFATGAVTATTSGGLVGLLNGSTVNRSFAHGSVTSNVGGGWAGGLIGRGQSQVNAPVSITESFATGAVSGDTAGGLLGQFLNTITIDNTYARGNVNGIVIGGLIGVLAAGTITRSYAAGTVDPNATSPGALVGDSSPTGGDTVTITGSAALSGLDLIAVFTVDVTVSNSATASASALKRSETYTAKMFDVDASEGWNANRMWSVCNGHNDGFPYFSWQVNASPCVTQGGGQNVVTSPTTTTPAAPITSPELPATGRQSTLGIVALWLLLMGVITLHGRRMPATRPRSSANAVHR